MPTNERTEVIETLQTMWNLTGFWRAGRTRDRYKATLDAALEAYEAAPTLRNRAEDAERRLAEADERLPMAHRHGARADEDNARLRRRLDSFREMMLMHEVERLRTALDRWSGHGTHCIAYRSDGLCSCEWDNARRGLAEAAADEREG
ncbi:MAG: hypothetical protein GKR89_13105 [Candidatus Latescibacteria bacterium]|nr:hypothetical protein [Candidatus Latescibacterota bacterium]